MAALAMRTLKRGAAGAALLLAACQQPPTVMPPPVLVAQPSPPAAPPHAAPREANSIEEYKEQVARHLMAANPELVFGGRLPEMMEAIVVLDIGIDRDGALASLRVHRAPGPRSAALAQQAVRAAAPFPKPGKLLGWSHHTLVFSETFLFNRDYRFQIRTLAGPQ